MANISILGGDFTVYFTNDASGDKQIRWTGAASGTRTVNELYSALEDLFDNNTAGVGDYMNEGLPMKGVTPTDYLIGRIETNDREPWFIDPDTIEHLTGGGMSTTGWTRVVGTATGIVKVAYTIGTDFSATDIGKTVTTSTDGDSGTLLYYDGSHAWIRPDSNVAGNSFDANPTSSDTITVTAGSAASVTQSSASTTGEQLWANPYTIGTVVTNTRFYVARNNGVLTNWWGDGAIDILVLVRDQGTFIDEGLLSIYARRPGTTYDHSVVDASGGGDIPVSISTVPDLNNNNGYRTISVSSAATAFSEGEIVTGQTNGGVGIVTENTGSPTTSFEYFLLGDLSQDFTNGETLSGSIVGNNGTAGTPANANASGYTDVTVTFGHNATFDVDGDSTNEDYSIVIDCNSRPLSEVYERLKYITRRGETSTLNGIEGQQYIGIDYRVDYNTLTGTINAGSTVTQSVTGGTTTAEVVGHNTTDKYLMLRDTRGASAYEVGTAAANLQVDGSNYVDMSGSSTATPVTPEKRSPFGTFAGGVFFGARGVVLDNVNSSDINNYFVVDDGGTQRAEPIQVTFKFTGVQTDSEVRLFDNDNVISLDTEITGTEQTTGSVQRATLLSSGSAYTASDVLTVVGGTGTAAQITVDSVGGSGEILTFTVSNGGSYTSNPSNPVSVTGGTGSSATFNLTISGEFQYIYTYTSDINATAVIFNTRYKEVRLSNLVLGNSNQTIPIQQITDRVKI